MRSVIELRRSAGIRPHWEIELDADAVHDSWSVAIANLETLRLGDTREHGTDSIQQT